MKFRLKYEGPLKTNGSKNHKHEIRKAFHPQLKNLLENSGLLIILNKANFMNPENEKSIIKKVGNFQFVNLVSSQIGLIAELDIIFMRPEEPGKMINSGDIDNRIKTLFDALRYPKEEQDLAYKLEKSQIKWPDGMHNLIPSLAIDSVPYHAQKPHIHWKDIDEMEAYKRLVFICAKKRGYKLRWGADWNQNGIRVDWDPEERLLDGPHYELVFERVLP